MNALTYASSGDEDDEPTAVHRVNTFLVPVRREQDAFAIAAAERETLPGVVEETARLWVQAAVAPPPMPRRAPPPLPRAPSMLPLWGCAFVAVLASVATVVAAR